MLSVSPNQLLKKIDQPTSYKMHSHTLLNNAIKMSEIILQEKNVISKLQKSLYYIIMRLDNEILLKDFIKKYNTKSHETFFTEGPFLKYVAEFSDTETLDLINEECKNNDILLKMPRIFPNNNFSTKLFKSRGKSIEHKWIIETELNTIPKENLVWLVSKGYLDKKYIDNPFMQYVKSFQTSDYVKIGLSCLLGGALLYYGMTPKKIDL